MVIYWRIESGHKIIEECLTKMSEVADLVLQYLIHDDISYKEEASNLIARLIKSNINVEDIFDTILSRLENINDSELSKMLYGVDFFEDIYLSEQDLRYLDRERAAIDSNEISVDFKRVTKISHDVLVKIGMARGLDVETACDFTEARIFGDEWEVVHEDEIENE